MSAEPFNIGPPYVVKSEIGSDIKGKFGYKGDGPIGADFVIKPDFDQARPFYNGRAIVGIKDGGGLWRYGVIGLDGKYIIRPQFNAIPISCWCGTEDDETKLIPVLIGDKESGKWGFVDYEGIYKIIPQFEGVQLYTEGLSAVKKMGLWGFINSDGSFIIKPQFEFVFAFWRGLAPVKIGGKWGYISR